MLMVGAGAQAPYQIAAMLLAMPGVDAVELCSPRSPAKAADRLPAVRQAVERLLGGCRTAPYTITCAEDLEAFWRDFSRRKLSYGDIEGNPDFLRGVCGLYRTLSPEHIIPPTAPPGPTIC